MWMWMSGSKFSGVPGRIREVPREESRDSPPPELAKIGRPPGKRSNPEWSRRTIMMHKHTHRSVARILLETDDTRDLSELMDDCYAHGLRNRHKAGLSCGQKGARL
jgi:hypothetical protein